MSQTSVSADGLLAAIREVSDDAILSQDRDGRITSWSLAAERLFAYSTPEILGRSSLDLFAGHARADVQGVFETAMAGDPVRRVETEARRKDAMPVPVSVSVCPVVDGRGVTVAVLLVVRDITEQRLAQATLAEVEERVRENEALAHLGSWLWDIGTDTVQWSDELHRIHGVDPLAFDGTFSFHLAMVHADDRARVSEQMADAVSSGRAFEAEYRVVRPDGGVRLLRARAQATLDSLGTPLGLQGVARDVTSITGNV